MIKFIRLNLVLLVIIILGGCSSNTGDEETMQIMKNELEEKLLEKESIIEKLTENKNGLEAELSLLRKQINNLEEENKNLQEDLRRLNVKVETQSKTITESDVQDITSLIPKGWHVLEKSNGELASDEGDLNNDGIIDKAVVIEETSQMEYAPPRNLLIAFGNEDGTFTLSIKVEKAMLLRNEGGGFGDPFDDIIIDRGSILLNFFGGSGERWYMNYRFRYQNDGWYLIGATEGSFVQVDNGMDNVEEDYNLLTGDYIIRKLEDGRIITTKGNRGKKQLVNLQDFDVDLCEKQF